MPSIPIRRHGPRSGQALWDLQFNGNIGFHFYYQSYLFAKPTDYGLNK